MKRLDHELLYYRHLTLSLIAFGTTAVLVLAAVILLCTGYTAPAIWTTIGALFCGLACKVEGKQADHHHTQWLRELGGWTDDNHAEHHAQWFGDFTD